MRHAGLLTLTQFLALPDRPGKQEFDHGRLIGTPPPKFAHTLTAKNIYDRLTTALEGSGYASFQKLGF